MGDVSASLRHGRPCAGPPLRYLPLREQHRDTIVSGLGRAAGNGHRTLEYLNAHPIVSANQLVERLADIGVLAEVTGRTRNRRFRYDPYVRLFADEPAAEDSV